MKISTIVIQTIFITGVLFNLQSCAPAYVPTMVNTPLFSEAGEFQAKVNYGTSGLDPQLAYSVSDHVGILANASFQEWTSPTTGEYHRHSLAEFGGGYYGKMGSIGRFEGYAGYGFGKIKADYSNDLWDSRTNVYLHKVFLQPGIGITTDYVDAAFSPRIAWADMSQPDEHATRVFFEPVITFKMGYKVVKGVVQMGFSLPLGTKELDFVYQPFMFSIGIQGSFLTKPGSDALPQQPGGPVSRLR